MTAQKRNATRAETKVAAALETASKPTLRLSTSVEARVYAELCVRVGDGAWMELYCSRVHENNVTFEIRSSAGAGAVCEKNTLSVPHLLVPHLAELFADVARRSEGAGLLRGDTPYVDSQEQRGIVGRT